METRNRKPAWLKAQYDKETFARMDRLMDGLALHTVCTEAECPNRGECFAKKTATFMILGAVCTRNCRYCAVTPGRPVPPDPQEPQNVARAAAELGLSHVVVTSVTRDDLPDGGGAHFAATIRALRAALPDAAVEVLIPDFKGNTAALDTVIEAQPDIIGHNLEAVERVFAHVRPGGDYKRSLDVLSYIRQKGGIIVKTGIMVGLGETEQEVGALMEDAAAAGSDILTIGQYLAPSKQHVPVAAYVTPAQFEEYRVMGLARGLGFVASGPLVRSSYRALEAYQHLLQRNRTERGVV